MQNLHMGWFRFGLIPVLAGLALWSRASTIAAAPNMAEQHPTKEGAEYFEKKIRPILVKHCYECHSGDVKKAKGSFVLDTRDGLRKGGQTGPVIAPGNPDDSLFIEAVRYQGLEMPPNEQLPEELIEE